MMDNPNWDRTMEAGTFSLCTKYQGSALHCGSNKMCTGDAGTPEG